MKAVGMITIGQSPRDDIVPEMEKLLWPEIRVTQAGALDGLSRAEIAALAPAPGQDALITRLTDGTSVVIAKQAIVDLLQARLDELGDGVDASVILCTGTFHLRSKHPILEPDRILFAAAQALFDGGRLGVLIPIPEQRESATARWGGVAERVTIAVSSPYRGPAGVAEGAEALRAAGATLVMMDCMGFTQAMKALVRDVVRAPVLLPSSLIPRFVAEVL
jgi:protein AroM